MTYIVTENCVNCKDTACVVVCPVDCFYEGANFLAIKPNECIDCGVCEYECPMKAIKPFYKNKATEEDQKWYDINEKYSQMWPRITGRLPPLPDADKWDRRKGYDGPDKADLIDPTPGKRE